MPNKQVAHIKAKLEGGNVGEVLDIYDEKALHTVDIANNLTTTTTGKVLDATQGKILKDQTDISTSNIATLTTRVDNIANLPSGSTTGDAELADIRVSTNGSTYTNAGNAVRAQINEAKSSLNALGDIFEDIKDSLTFSEGHYINHSGTMNNSSAWTVGAWGKIYEDVESILLTIPLSSNNTQLSVVSAVCFYEKEDVASVISNSFVPLSSGTFGCYEWKCITIPEGAKTFKVSVPVGYENDFHVYEIKNSDKLISSIRNDLFYSGEKIDYSNDLVADSYIRYTDGARISSSSGYWVTTPYIKVHKYSSIKYNRPMAISDASSETAVVGMAFYDSNYNYISGEPIEYSAPYIGASVRYIEVPQNTTFARFTQRIGVSELEIVGIIDAEPRKHSLGLRELRPIDIPESGLSADLDTGIYNVQKTDVDSLTDLPEQVPGALISIVPDIYNHLLSKRFQMFYLTDSTKPLVYIRIHLGGSSDGWTPWSALKFEESVLYKSYVDTRIETIRSYERNLVVNSTSNRIDGYDSFLFFTDYHSANNRKGSIPTMNYIAENAGASHIACAGDLINNTTSKEAMDMIADIANGFSFPMFCINGNHDFNNSSNTNVENAITESDVYGLIHTKNEFNEEHVIGTLDYCVDNKNKKIRYVYLSCDSDVNFFTWSESALNAMLSNVPTGYSVVIITHYGVEINLNGRPTFTSAGSEQAIVDMQSEITGAIPSSFNSIATIIDNFNANHVSEKVIAVLSGHNHIDLHAETPGGIPVISTTCDTFESSYSFDENGTLISSKANGTDRNGRKRYKNSSTEQAIDYVIIDKINKCIKMFRIGNGDPALNGYSDYTMTISRPWASDGSRTFSFASIVS